MTEPIAEFCPECGTHLEAGAHFCAVCGHQVPGGTAAGEGVAATASTPPATQPSVPAPEPMPAPAADAAAQAIPPSPPPWAPAAMPPPVPGPQVAGPPQRSRAGWYAAFASIALVVVLGIIAAIVLIGGEDPEPASADEVLLESIGQPAVDPFTASVTSGAERAPTTTAGSSTTTTAAPTGTGGQQIAGSKPGLYGGTQNSKTCDAEQLISFLQANPDKGAAWAAVLGIATADIPTYVRSLTPVLLTRDTRVTNHGFKNGKATTIPAVLQAGTAVMVDRNGVPRVKCACGNPLTEPAPVTASTTYTGTRWPGFQPTAVVHVTLDVEVNVFVLVDVDGDGVFSRTPGSAGVDTPMSIDELCDLYPDEPTCATTTTTAPTTTTTAPTTTTTAAPLPPAPQTTLPPQTTGDRSGEAIGWITAAIDSCDPSTSQYITSIDAFEIQTDLYQVEVRIQLDSGGWLAVFQVDFATEDFPQVTPADPDSASLICF